MRIGINAVFYAVGGSLLNLRQLLEDWDQMEVFKRHKVVLFTGQGTLPRLADIIPKEVQVITLRQSDRGIASRLMVEQATVVRQVAKHRLDVLFCPANTMPLATRVPCVTTFQNAAPFCDGVTRASMGTSAWLRLVLLGRFVRLSARRATRVIFISQYFRDLFVQRFAFPAGKGVVIYRAREHHPEGAQDDLELEQRLGIRRPYILSVSHLYPYKNLMQLLEGFVLSCRNSATPAPQLVLAGQDFGSGHEQQLRDLMTSLGVDEQQVLLLGDVPYPQIRKLLAGCACYAFSSTCENCPTSLIEALASGRAIACSNVGVMPEIAADAALYFDPKSPSDIGRVLSEIMGDAQLRERLGALALQRAAQFPDREAVARATIAVIEDAATA